MGGSGTQAQPERLLSYALQGFKPTDVTLEAGDHLLLVGLVFQQVLLVPRDRRLCLVDIGDQFKDNAKDLPEQIKDMDVGNTVEDVD